MSEAHSDDIERLLSMPDDQLYAELARNVSKGAIKGDAVGRGKEIFANLRTSLRKQICESSDVRSAYAMSKNDTTALVAALVDCIAGAISGVAPATFAVLIVKYGLERYCRESWDAR